MQEEVAGWASVDMVVGSWRDVEVAASTGDGRLVMVLKMVV